ncbi:MAG: PAS domain-containing protein, partial [Candidatus Thiodiazotropha sp. (ex. Lucinisca nassula)]|nr:PAS domain-containing protein [Candidatus Thiodiazotropha sp. (ex. Lucinisca nassula)]
QLLSYADVIHPKDRGIVSKQITAAIDKGVTFEIEYRIFDLWQRDSAGFGKEGLWLSQKTVHPYSKVLSPI